MEEHGYKRYLEDYTEGVPRRTQIRRENRREDEDGHDENEEQQQERNEDVSDLTSDEASDHADDVSIPDQGLFRAMLEEFEEVGDPEPGTASAQSDEEIQNALHEHEINPNPDEDVHLDEDGDAVVNSEEEDNQAEFQERRPQRIQIPNGDEPITSSDMTRMDSLLSVLSFAIKHHISGVALEDLITLINLHCPNSLPPSKYLFGSSFTDYKGTCDFHMYCSACKGYVGKIPDLPDQCESCGEEVNEDKNMKEGRFFMVLPLSCQIKHLLESTKVGEVLVNRTIVGRGDAVSDVTDGEMYRHLVNDGLLDDSNNLSLMFNTDGVPIFKSSRSSIWPLLCTINELPMKVRKENVMLLALWFGDEKPDMNVFLKPFVDECNHLSSIGLEWTFHGTEKTSKVYPLLCSVDSVARPLMQKMVQFNGFYGCSFCKQKGEFTDGAMKYPYEHNPSPKRTDVETKEQSILAEETGRSIQGVKGVSVLSFLMYFNIISSFIPDYMHAVCLGTVKRFASLWLNPSSRHEAYYIGQKKEEINERINSVQCTKEVTRIPRSLRDIKFWKANEWRTFMYFSPLILKGILPIQYLAHWSMLVVALFHLNSVKVSRDTLQLCEFMIKKFILYIEPLYGKREATFNAHLLLHMTESVRNWGPLWGTSAFAFESFNGYLKKLFAGTRYLPQQIFQTLCRLQDLEANVQFVCSREASDYISKMVNGQHLLKSVQRFGTDFEEIVCLGCAKLLELSQLYRTAIQEYLEETVIIDSVECFDKFVYKNILFTTQLYCNKFKRRDSIFSTGDSIGEILHFITFKNHNCTPIEDCRCVQHYLILVQKLNVTNRLNCLYREDPELGTTVDFINKVRRGGIVALKCDVICTKGMLVKLGNEEFVVNLPNLVEGD